MCGRYTLGNTSPATLGQMFGVSSETVPLEALGNDNVSPTDPVLAVIGDGLGARRAGLLRWGLAPSWATLRGQRPLINARDDKLRTSNAWRPLVRRARTRCLVVADGWLEWKRAEDPRRPGQPFVHRLRGGAPFAFAGVWCIAQPRDADGEIASCAIVTTQASREAAHLHDRMPAVLASAEEQAAWLDGEVDLDGALELVRPLPEGSLEIVPVDSPVAKPASDQLSLLG
jgi:putative SOS response-associated peptidase YedK